MAADNGSTGTPIRHTAGTNGARSEYGVLARCEYSLLVPTGTAVDLADVGDLGRQKGHEATREVAVQARRATEKCDEIRQCALPSRGMQGDDNKERKVPKRSRALNMCGHQGGREGWTPHPSAHSHGAHPGTWGDPQTQQRAPLV